jgi:hypothetical protein
MISSVHNAGLRPAADVCLAAPLAHQKRLKNITDVAKITNPEKPAPQLS